MDVHDRWYFTGILFIVFGVVVCLLGLLQNFGIFNPDSQTPGLGVLIFVLGLFSLAVGIVMHYIGSTGISNRESKE